MNHYLYKIMCHHPRHSGKEYIGIRSCDCPIDKDSYMGSGAILMKMQSGLGIEHFSKEILGTFPTREALSAAEAAAVTMEYVESPHTLNLQTGGEDGGIPGEETRQKISEANTGENNGMKRPEVAAKISGENNGMWGRKQTVEACQKNSEAVSKALLGRTNVYYLESRKTDCIPKEEYHKLKAEGKVIHVASKQYRELKALGLT